MMNKFLIAVCFREMPFRLVFPGGRFYKAGEKIIFAFVCVFSEDYFHPYSEGAKQQPPV
jgi:hypothetical protein